MQWSDKTLLAYCALKWSDTWVPGTHVIINTSHIEECTPAHPAFVAFFTCVISDMSVQIPFIVGGVLTQRALVRFMGFVLCFTDEL